MLKQHTPGPWKAHFEEAYFVTGPDLGRVAMMMNLKGAHGLGGRRSGDESASNARLIAAAPDLLEALNTWLEKYSAEEYKDCPEVVKTRAALTKASGSTTQTGETE